MISGVDPPRYQLETDSALVIVDRDLCVVFEPSEREAAFAAFDRPPVDADKRLLPAIEAIVRDVAGEWLDGAAVVVRDPIAVPQFGTMRLMLMAGVGACLLAMLFEPAGANRHLSRARRRFALTQREQEVLWLILEGAPATEIAARLSIAETTVQGYFKKLLSKTGARNRAAMVATVLEWPGLARNPVGSSN
ncbi:MAG: LuxR C-terminal-related transcriptional regulator [Vulcanimicrobiaceae bacterium]